MNVIDFTPDVRLDAAELPVVSHLKGLTPQHDYQFNLIQIYGTVPSLSAKGAYEQIALILDRLERNLDEKLPTRSKLLLPQVATDQEALQIISILLNPCSYFKRDEPVVSGQEQANQTFCLDRPRPFRLEVASPRKILHTLAWVDINIKLNVERILFGYDAPLSMHRAIVDCALHIYTLLAKMNDHKLASSMNFNYSMFLQDRILQLIFGDALFFQAGQYLQVGLLSNQMALALLKRLGPLSHEDLCVLSVFMGIVWTNQPELQQAFLTQPGLLATRLQTAVEEVRGKFCIDHVQEFLADANRDSPEMTAVVLDDNGESIFDLALFQNLLKDNVQLSVAFVVNRYPISTNISLQLFDSALAEPYFAYLRSQIASGRVRVVIEEQSFRSFEESLLSKQTLTVLQEAGMAYIKGVNFFETFQPTQLPRYYCFTVSGENCVALTGCREGSGIVAKVPSGEEGYIYHDANHIITLREILNAQLTERRR